MFDFLYQTLVRLGYTHPIHPTQVNMPIGLLVGSFALILIASMSRNKTMIGCVRFCAAAGLIFLVPTVIAGIMDWQQYFSGAWIFPIKIKMVLAGALFFLLLIALIISRNATEISKSVAVLFTLCLSIVIVLAYLGAELVFAGRTPPALPEYTVGREIFRSNCSGCHPYGANIVVSKDHIWNSKLLEKPQYFSGWLRQPVPPMPAFSPIDLSDNQVSELYSYLDHLFQAPAK